MATTLNWLILGCGNIAKAFARGVAHSHTGKLVAVASRTKEKAEKFGAEHGVDAAKCYGSYEAALQDPNVQAVYIATPHPQHAEWAIKAARAKKHLLVEKPLAVNSAQTMAIVEAAQVNDVFLMEAYMYRCHPQTAKLVELVQSGAIGDVRMIVATFAFQTGFNADGRLFKNELAGGGILDVGGYAVSMARLLAGAAAGKPFLDPTNVSGVAHLGETGVDEYAAAVLKFPSVNGKPPIIAQVATGVALNQDNSVRLFGTAGNIVAKDCWTPAREGGSVTIELRKNGQPLEEIKIETAEWLYGLEADVVAKFVERRTAESPAMSVADSIGQARTEDRWRESAGLQYTIEKTPGYSKLTITGEELRKPAKTNMKYARVPGVAKDISRLVMGCDNQTNFPHMAVMLDDWFERGGNCFDTSFIYGGGTQERLLGQWMSHRGVREQCVTIAKGLHTPNTFPARLEIELPETLERLKTDYTDLYIMHRDNPAVPVGEFVEAVNRFIKAGKIKAWGGSNWNPPRFDEAVAYAKKNNLVAPIGISNNFSLARMIDPIWGGCISASDSTSRAWFEKTQTSLFAWSSQARGFFLEGNARPEKKEDAELVRCWYSEDNFARLARVNELAKKKGVLPINIALAYVLHQPFPTFALIGPRTLGETRTSLQALDVSLTPDEVKWLNLEQPSV